MTPRAFRPFHMRASTGQQERRGKVRERPGAVSPANKHNASSPTATTDARSTPRFSFGRGAPLPSSSSSMPRSPLSVATGTPVTSVTRRRRCDAYHVGSRWRVNRSGGDAGEGACVGGWEGDCFYVCGSMRGQPDAACAAGARGFAAHRPPLPARAGRAHPQTWGCPAARPARRGAPCAAAPPPG